MPAILSALLVVLLSPLPADGWLGVYLDPEHAAARIVEVIPGTPADRAGLVAGDLVLSVDGRLVKTSSELVGAIAGRKAGQRVRLVVGRGDKRVQMLVRLASRPGERQLPGQVKEPAHERAGRPDKRGSPKVRPLPRRDLDGAGSTAPQRSGTGESAGTVAGRSAIRQGYLGLGLVQHDGRLRVTRVLEQGPAARAGVRVGDVLLAWNGREVESLVGLDSLLGRALPGDPLLLQLRRQEREHLLELELGEPPPADPEVRPGAPGGSPPADPDRQHGGSPLERGAVDTPRPSAPGARAHRFRAP